LELLDKVGFQTRGVGSGEEALQAHDAWQPDLILMDLRMPGIGGIEAVRQLRQQGSQVPVVALTASSVGDMKHDALQAGANAYMTKPYRETELLRVIGELLGARFIYDQRSRTPMPFPSPAAIPAQVLSQQLKAVPASLRAELREATIQARIGHIRALADRVAEHDASAARQVLGLAEEFRYEQLIAVLDEADRT
jgi:CheY-like chemotaxis protein